MGKKRLGGGEGGGCVGFGFYRQSHNHLDFCGSFLRGPSTITALAVSVSSIFVVF